VLYSYLLRGDFERNRVKKMCTFGSRRISVPTAARYVGKSVKKKKVKFTLVQALRLCTGRTAHRGSRGTALLFHGQRH
jgi:hypothetical protein